MLKKLLTAVVLMSAFGASAKTIWSDFSLTFLSGSDYEVGDASRDVITFEYVSGTTWGDNFMFFDRLESANGDVETYGEYSPRFKVKELDGFVKAVYVAPSIEMGPGTNYLLGVGTDLNVPHFAFFQANAYLRDNNDGDTSFQATLVWGLPVGPLWYDGFMDFATGYDLDNGFKAESSMNLTSQLKYDVAPHFDLENKLYVGIEYVFWNNKFGLKDLPFETDERNLNLLVKYHF